MAFADDAIGFYLQIDDQLSPALEKAANNYDKFVKHLDQANTAAFNTVNKGMNALANAISFISDLPTMAAKKYQQTVASIQKQAQKGTIKQKLEFEVSMKSRKGITQAVMEGLSKFFSRTRIRMTAAVPLQRSKLFDQSQALRQTYREMSQPPDMVGRMMGVPRFQKGGMVDGPDGTDRILALLTKGEFVVPKDKVASLANALQDLASLRQLMSSGIDPKAGKKYAKTFKQASITMQELQKAASTTADEVKQELAPGFAELNAELEQFNQTSEDTGKVWTNILKRVLGAQQFENVMKSMETVGNAIGEARNQTASLFGEIDEGKLKGFNEVVNDIGRGWGMTREQTVALRDSLDDLSDSRIGLNLISESAKGLVEAGASTEAQLKKLSKIGAAAAKAGLGDISEQLLVMSDGMDMSQDQIANTVNQMIALNQASGLGEEGVSSLFTKMTQAASGNQEVLAQLQMLGVNIDEFKKTGDATSAIQSFSKTLGTLDPQSIALMQEVLEIDLNTGQVVGFQKNWEGINATVDSANETFTKTADKIGAVSDAASRNDTVFERVSNTVSKFAQENFGGLIAVFEEFNPMIILATVQLASMAFTMLATVVPAIGSFVAGLFGLGAAGPAAAGGSTAAAGGMTALSAGITALTPAIPVILTLAAAAIALGAALWLAAPAIDAVVDGFVAIFGILATMSFTQMAAVAGGMYMLGPAFAVLGAGLLAFSSMAAASSVGLLVFHTTMMLMGAGNSTGIGNIINDLVDGFEVDRRKMKNAIASMKGAVEFMAGFSKLALMITGMAALSVLQNAVEGILGFFGVKSPMEQLSDQSKEIVDTINKLTKNFMAINLTVDQVPALQTKMSAVTSLLDGLQPIFAKAGELGELSSSLDDSFFGLWSGPLTELTEIAPDMKNVLNTLFSNFMAVDITDPSKFSARMQAIADSTQQMRFMIRNFHQIAKMGDIDVRTAGRSIRQSGEMIKRLTEAAQASLEQPITIPTSVDVEQTISLRTSLDKQTALLMEQNQILRQILAAQSGNQPVQNVTQPRREHGAATPRPSAFTNALAGGDM